MLPPNDLNTIPRPLTIMTLPMEMLEEILSHLDLFDSNELAKVSLLNHHFLAATAGAQKKVAQAAIESRFGDIIVVDSFPIKNEWAFAANWAWIRDWYPRVYSIAADKRAIIRIFEWMRGLAEDYHDNSNVLGLHEEDMALLEPLRGDKIDQEFNEALDYVDDLHYPNFASATEIVDFIKLEDRTMVKVKVVWIRLLAALLAKMVEFACAVRGRVIDEGQWHFGGVRDALHSSVEELCLLTRGLTPIAQMLRYVLCLQPRQGLPIENLIAELFNRIGDAHLWGVNAARMGDRREDGAGTWDLALCRYRICNMADDDDDDDNAEDGAARMDGDEYYGAEEDWEGVGSGSDDDDSTDCYGLYHFHACAKVYHEDSSIESRLRHEDWLVENRRHIRVPLDIDDEAMRLGRFDLMLDADLQQLSSVANMKRQDRYWNVAGLLEIINEIRADMEGTGEEAS